MIMCSFFTPSSAKDNSMLLILIEINGDDLPGKTLEVQMSKILHLSPFFEFSDQKLMFKGGGDLPNFGFRIFRL